jgi:membrane protease YdiL (CAAX protease family)
VRHDVPRETPAADPTFPAGALPLAVGGIVATVLAGRALSSVLLERVDAPVEIKIIVFYAVVFGGLWSTCKVASARHGSGRPLRDLGWSWTPSDLWRGIGGFFLARLAHAIAILPWFGDLDRLSRLTEGYEHVSTASFVIFSIAAVVGAPLLEELAFRGLLQRSLASAVGQRWAIVLQAAAFGLYHFIPEIGTLNAPYVVGLAAAGLVLGWLACRAHRLGPSVSTHFFMNALAVVVVAFRR